MPDQALLIRTLVELADTLVDDFDLVEMLTLLSDRCVDVLGVAAAGVMLAAPSGALQVIASSSEAMRTLELFQLQSDEGPCVEAYKTAAAVVNVDLAASLSTWPRFAARAARDGFRSAHSLPLRLRGHALGALNLLRSASGAFPEVDVAAAQALADIASIAIVQHQVVIDAQTLNDQLTTALQSRVVIEQAKGRISEACSLTMEQAFGRLRHHARAHNLRLTELASGIAEGTVNPRSLDAPPRTPRAGAAAGIGAPGAPLEAGGLQGGGG